MIMLNQTRISDRQDVNMVQMPTPHDAVFKTFLSPTQTARDFITRLLPPALLAICDLPPLKLESGSFVEDDDYSADSG